MHFLWVILIGSVAGMAKLIVPGDKNEPKGFVLTTVLRVKTWLPCGFHLFGTIGFDAASANRAGRASTRLLS
jgi:hypothetical protein